MMRKRESHDEIKALSEQRKSLIERYMLDAAEAPRREPAAAETVAREPVAEPEPHLAPRPDPSEAIDVTPAPQRAASNPSALFSARRRYLVLLGCSAVAAASYATNWHSPVRVAVTAVFLLFLPGLALAELAPPADAAQRVVVGVGASLALETLVAVAFVYSGYFTPGRVFAVSLAATAAFIAAAALRGRQPS
jgi:hypothetical protein